MRATLQIAVILVSLNISKANFKNCRIEDIQKDLATFEFLVPNECVKLAIGGAKLGDEGTVALMAALEKSYAGGGLRSLVELGLPTTGMGPKGARATARFVISTGLQSPIRILNMYGNAIGDEGAVELSAVLTARIPVETFGLGVNSIGAAGARALAGALVDCATCAVRTLGLYRNSIGDEGAAALAAVVARNRAPLVSLFIGGNFVGNTGAVALATALASNTHLKALSLEGGTVGDAGALALGAAAAASRSLATLDVRSCLPTHRNCHHGHMSVGQVMADGANDPTKMTRTGILALHSAVTARRAAGGVALKVTGDVDFENLQ